MNKLQRRQAGVRMARRVLRALRNGGPNDEFYADGGRYEQIILKNRKVCSRPCCGNPRRHFGHKTRQELIADQVMESE